MRFSIEVFFEKYRRGSGIVPCENTHEFDDILIVKHHLRGPPSFPVTFSQLLALR